MSFGEQQPFGNRVFSLGEVEALRRMTVQKNQEQQQQISSGGSTSSTTGGGNQQPQGQQQNSSQSQLPSNPFVVLTQVPIQATPFANFANTQGNKAQQQPSGQGGGARANNDKSVQQQQQQSSGSLAQDNVSWTHLLQPTPLAPDHFHNPSAPQQQLQNPTAQQLQQGATMSLPQQQQQAQQMTMTQQQRPQQQQQPNNSNNSFTPSTLSFLQELMMNAATAALQQKQQQMMQQNNSNNSQQGFPQQQQPQSQQFQGARLQQQQQQPPSATGGQQAFTVPIAVDSSVSPVTRPESSGRQATDADGVQAWTKMWDSASKTMFQQKHQLLLQRAASTQPRDKLSSANSNGSSGALPAQPAKRKFDDLDRANVCILLRYKRLSACVLYLFSPIQCIFSTLLVKQQYSASDFQLDVGHFWQRTR